MSNKKKEILEVATKLFAKNGFENTSITNICEEAKVSKGLIFHHFQSKNDLLRKIYEKTSELIIEINKSKETTLTPKERLLELLESFFAKLESDKLFFQLSLNISLQPSTRDILDDLIKIRSSFILNSVKSIFDEISADKSTALCYMFIAELDGIALNYLYAFEEYPLHIVKEELLNKYNY